MTTWLHQPRNRPATTTLPHRPTTARRLRRTTTTPERSHHRRPSPLSPLHRRRLDLDLQLRFHHPPRRRKGHRCHRAKYEALPELERPLQDSRGRSGVRLRRLRQPPAPTQAPLPRPAYRSTGTGFQQPRRREINALPEPRQYPRQPQEPTFRPHHVRAYRLRRQATPYHTWSSTTSYHRRSASRWKR